MASPPYLFPRVTSRIAIVTSCTEIQIFGVRMPKNSGARDRKRHDQYGTLYRSAAVPASTQLMLWWTRSACMLFSEFYNGSKPSRLGNLSHMLRSCVSVHQTRMAAKLHLFQRDMCVVMGGTCTLDVNFTGDSRSKKNWEEGTHCKSYKPHVFTETIRNTMGAFSVSFNMLIRSISAVIWGLDNRQPKSGGLVTTSGVGFCLLQSQDIPLRRVVATLCSLSAPEGFGLVR